jgi:hypothetical protein
MRSPRGPIAAVALAALLALAGAGSARGQETPAPPAPPPDLAARVRTAAFSGEFSAAPLEEVAERISLRTGIRVRLSEELVAVAGRIRVTIRAKDAPLARFLDVLAADYGLAWSIEGDFVRLTVAPPPPQSPKPP